MKHHRLAACILFILCVVSSTAYSGNLLLMIAPLLGKHSSSTEPLSHQAFLVGPLSGTSIKAFTIEELTNPVEGPKEAVQSNSSLLAAGTFDLALAGLADNEWIVAEASGGKDIDADRNGIADASPTQNLGTLHALARASDWRSKHLKITPLTEIGWRYVENLISVVSAEELEIRLADLARYLIKSDIDGNGTIDWNDILAFDPEKAADRDKLAFDYDWLSTANDAGQTILASLRAGETDAMLAHLDETFSWLMTRFPVPDSRYHTVQVALSVFGPGKATSGEPHNLSVDSTLAKPVHEDHILVSKDESGTITFTATAGTNAQILGWSGCENVSADLSQCMVSLNRSQSVVANFGSTETILKGVVHDLSRTNNIIGTSSVAVFLPSDMNDLIAEMAAAQAGDFIVGDDGGGFLRKITGINKISSTYYQLQTVEAALDEVVSQGTGHIYKQLTNGELEGYAAPAAAGLRATVSPTAFTGIEGAALKAAESPDNQTITIKLGNQSRLSTSEAQAMGQSLAETVTLYDDHQGGTLSATGEISLDVSLDGGADYNPLSGLQAFKFIVKVDAEQKIQLTASSELAKFDLVKKKIGTLKFEPIPITGLPIPVWVTPTVDIFFFVEGSVEAKVSFGLSFSQNAEGGLLYNKDTGFSVHKHFASERSFIFPEASLSAAMKGGVEISPALKIYDFTGPALPQQIYSKIESAASINTKGCAEIVLQNIIGCQSDFKWDMGGSIQVGDTALGKTKFGEFLHLDELEEKSKFNIFSMEWPYESLTLYNNCPDYQKGSFLIVEGDGIFSTIDAGDSNGLTTALTVSNTGDEELHWNTQNGSAAVTISPSSGVLAPGEKEIVQMSVATAGLPVGQYLRKLFFYNEASTGKNLPDEQFGNTYKTINITVNDIIDDAPTITSANSPAVGKAALNWSFTPSSSEPFIGFQIYATQTPENPLTYELVHITDIFHRQAVISGLASGKIYSFDMRAYSNNGARPGPFSNKVSVQIMGNPVVVKPTILNDTGITWSGNYASGNNTACVSSTTPDGDNVVAAQDCSHGRDVTHNDDSDGHAGFSYTKLDSNGQPLADQSADYATTPWACVKDNVTGLIWEVKTDDGGLHDKDNYYTWYNTDPKTNGGADGYADTGGNTCYGYDSSNPNTFCNTQAYVSQVNAAGWCGASDWRMPTRKELESLLHYGRSNPATDNDYFPNVVSSSFSGAGAPYWSGSPYAGSYANAWAVSFYIGYSTFYESDYYCAARLVRDEN